MKLGFILAYTGTQNNRFWSAGYPLLPYEVPLHNDYVGAWCPASAARIIRPVFFWATPLHQYQTLSDTVMNRCPLRENLRPFLNKTVQHITPQIVSSVM